MASNSKKSGKKTKLIISLILAIIVIVGTVIGESLLGSVPAEQESGSQYVDSSSFSVHFIDVGQGDCTLIKTDKGNMLIDAGENGTESRILNYLAEQNVDEIEYFIATHPHSDHIGGAAEIISNIKINNVIMPRLTASNTPTSKTYENMLNALKSTGVKVISATPGKSYSFGDVSFMVLSPFKQDDNLNNMSVSLKLTYDAYSFMFTGDAEKEVEKQLIDAGYDLSADVFKMAHHGSATSNTFDFFNAISPEYAVISCSEDNSYGHPHKEIIDMLDESDARYFITYESGDVVFTVDSRGLSVKTKKN